MKVAPEIMLKDVEMTPLIDKLINRGISKLEQVCDYIISTHIVLEKAQGRRRTGNAYRMRIDIRIPDRVDIIVNRSSKALKKIPGDMAQLQGHLDEAGVEPASPELFRSRAVTRQGVREEPLQALIRRTFDSARRELERAVDKRHGDVKAHPQQRMQAVIERLFPEGGYGFLRTVDGEQVYFHQNSVLHNHWERLAVGTAVRYSPEIGDKGVQASTVEPVEKPGAIERHGELHDLPEVI